MEVGLPPVPARHDVPPSDKYPDQKEAREMNRTPNGPRGNAAEGAGSRPTRPQRGARSTAETRGSQAANMPEAPAAEDAGAEFESVLEENLLLDVRNPRAVVP